jgi:hypothetical protein
MGINEQNQIKILKLQFAFLEKGSRSHSIRTSWKRTTIFQGLPTCFNYNDPGQRHPCNECVLIAFVPSEKREESIPCRYIPMTRLGDTIESMESWAGREQLEDVVKNWLRDRIKKLEEKHITN